MVPVTGRQIRLVLLTTVGAMLSWLFVNTMFGVQWDSSIVSRLRAPSFTIEGISRSTKNEYDSSQYVNGPPTRFLHDNLRNDTRYVTAFMDAGLTNEVMNNVNIIYLAMLSSRIPILPPHVPMHVGSSDDVRVLHTGDVWDLESLRREIRYPVIEWRDVKRLEDEELDLLGCWTVWATSGGRDGWPRGSGLFYELHIDVSFTPVPDSTKLLNFHNSFHGIAALGFPTNRAEGLVQGPQSHERPSPFPSPLKDARLEPDDHLMCLDIAYYLGGANPYEWEKDHSFAWRFVGRHLKWHKRITGTAEKALRQLWGVRRGEEIPHYIGIHIRHGDFGNLCGGTPLDTCFAPLYVIAQHVEQVKFELYRRNPSSPQIDHVLMTSDEKDPLFWEEVRRRGWSHFDWKDKGSDAWSLAAEAQTETGINEKWWPTLIDAACQSMGKGFVGTDPSTMSLLAMKRVQEWNDGVGVMVQFGANMYPKLEED